MTGIDWTEKTWNPVAGCKRVSRGCNNCYAMATAVRLEAMDRPIYRGTTKKEKGRTDWTGHINTSDEALERPGSWKKPTIIFVNSMSDLFHEDVPRDFIDKVYEVMETVDRHVYQVLTKRSAGMREYLNARYQGREPPEHIWHGVSVEANDLYPRIRHLRETNSAVRFLSLEPLLGPMSNLPLDGIHWVIVGGESGPGHRHMDESWVLDIRYQCRDAQVPFFFKQWGGKTSKSGGKKLEGSEWQDYPIDVSRFAKGGKMTTKQLEKLAAKVKDLIERAESGRVDDYVKAGSELIAAKAAVRKAGRKWGEWLEGHDIPQRTATRAMQYAGNPDKYRDERVKDALAKREKAKQNGQSSGQKRALLKVVHDATDPEIEVLFGLMSTTGSLKRLFDMLPAPYRARAILPPAASASAKATESLEVA